VTTLCSLECVIGIPTTTGLAEVAEQVARALGVPFHARESSYWGDPYYSGPLSRGFRLTENLDPMFRADLGDPPDEEAFFAEAPECRVLLWVTDEPVEAEELVRSLDAALGLNCKVLEVRA
jgi:hypothetical protein